MYRRYRYRPSGLGFCRTSLAPHAPASACEARRVNAECRTCATAGIRTPGTAKRLFHRFVDRMRPGAFGLFGDDRVGFSAHQDADRAIVILGIELGAAG